MGRRIRDEYEPEYYKPEEMKMEEKKSEFKDFDPINPDYYRRFGGVEVNDITKWLSFNTGNVVKYCARAGHKDGREAVQDLKKAQWYLESEIDRLS